MRAYPRLKYGSLPLKARFANQLVPVSHTASLRRRLPSQEPQWGLIMGLYAECGRPRTSAVRALTLLSVSFRFSAYIDEVSLVGSSKSPIVNN